MQPYSCTHTENETARKFITVEKNSGKKRGRKRRGEKRKGKENGKENGKLAQLNLLMKLPAQHKSEK